MELPGLKSALECDPSSLSHLVIKQFFRDALERIEELEAEIDHRDNAHLEKEGEMLRWKKRAEVAEAERDRLRETLEEIILLPITCRSDDHYAHRVTQTAKTALVKTKG